MKSLGTRNVDVEFSPDVPATREPEPVRAPQSPARKGLGTRQMKPSSRSSAHVDGQLPQDHLLQERYRILGMLTVGGMGALYKAQDLRFPKVTRLCVVKEMLNTATDPQVRAMMERNFEREANILATLNHPGVVRVYDYFSEGERNYIVMEYIDGKNLEEVLAETDGFLSEAQVVQWTIQVCEVLNYLHNHEPQPIIFRDLKPSNIMLESRGDVRLVDFGIAKVFQSGQQGTMIGTEGYTPPEQYRGVAEPRVDIYALGATMHHLLSKQDPQLEPPFSFHERPIHEKNPLASRELVDVIDRALDYEINNRYGSAAEMQRALMGLGSARGVGTATFGTTAFVSSDVLPLWRFACEDEVRSTPAVHDGIVYIGAYDNNLYVINADSGQFLWKYATEGGIGSSPCVYGGRVFFGSADRVLYAVDVDTGRISWTCPTKGSVWSSPRAAFDHVFFGSDDRFLYAVSVHSGRIAWKFEADGKVRSSPTIGDNAVYVGCAGGMVYSVGINGEAGWRFRARRAVISSPAVTQEMVYVGCQDEYVYGLDIRSGWKSWDYRTGGPVVSSPVVSDGLVFVGSVDTYFYALDAENGRLVWRYATDGQVTSSSAIIGEAVYFGSTDGTVYSLDIKTGNLRWRFQTDGPVTSSPRAVGGVVYIGSCDRYVYALPG
ncbi:MAG: serine/threonine-protein kinase [Chloroflexota bacterium]|nr:serine/threonine-protein kinase [Chloroflexota bacterium]